jgi:Arylsulfotransferase (ASST)/Abnormal spindle-like microcephaly-assoc'd, ASPM-SPD-2-Hydin
MFLLLFILLFAGLSLAQDSNIEKYQYISPLPDSKLIMPENNIIIRQGDIVDPTTIKEVSIEVVGSISGVHSGEFFLSDDMRTLIFIPSIPFTPGEKVNVKLYSGIYTANGDMLSPINFDFYISQTISNNVRDKALDDVSDFPISNANTKNDTYFLKSKKDINWDLPEDFPKVTVSISNHPAPGYIFLAPYDYPSYISSYLLIVDNSGIPVYYQKFSSLKTDFTLQPNGFLSYYNFQTRKYFIMDSSYSIVDSFSCRNGYSTDFHEFLLLANGHSFLISYDPQIVRMDTVAQGGDSSAVVLGLVIQELDSNKNVIFQWRSWDHFQITDATEDIDLTAHTIDYVHGNAIELDYDGNLLLSSRHLDEITKINRQSGEIIWRWGGLKSRNNEILFVNDPITFSHQHDIRRANNGNLTIFDNGNLRTPRFTRSLEYQFDEGEKIAVLLWKYNNEPETYARAMGSSMKLSNNNTFIGWGLHSNVRSVSEIKIDGTIALELLLPDNIYSYRVFKFPWKTNLFVTDPDSVFFESIPVGDSAVTTINLVNNSSENKEITITGFFNKDSSFVIEHVVPFVLPPNGSEPIEIKFKPLKEGHIKDTLHIRSDTDTSRVAQILVLTGITDTVLENGTVMTFYLEQNYPNPFNLSTIIRYSIPIQSKVNLTIYNSIGENIAKLVDVNQAAGSYEINWDAGIFASGIYFYSIIAVPVNGNDIFQSVRKMILLK